MTATTIERTPHRTIRALGRRWPTALAIAMTVVTAGGDDAAGQLAGLSETLLLLPMIYLVTARTGRRGLSWPLLAVAFVLIIGLRASDLVPAPLVIVPLAAALLAWSVIGGHAHSGSARLQALGVLGFFALALGAMAVDLDLGLYLVAAGWLFHAVWDFVHLRLDRVVARSYAEWCGVFDLLVAVQLLLLT